MKITEAKLLNAIKYFVQNTENVGLTKLFKLLYFLDFMYVKKHGIAVTLMDYYTYEFGPVPDALYKQILNDRLPLYLSEEVGFIRNTQEDSGKPYYKVHLKNRKIDTRAFAPYELKMLETVAEIFKYANAGAMTEVSHLKNSPWEKTLRSEGMHKLIPYNLAHDEDSEIDDQTMMQFLQIQREQRENGRI